MANTSHARFYALLNRIPEADKEMFVWQYSHSETTSLSEFYERRPEQYRHMIADMQRLIDELYNNEEIRRLRSAVLVRMQKYGVDTTDWAKVNAFTAQARIAGKTLGEMNMEDLRRLIPKLEIMLRKK